MEKGYSSVLHKNILAYNLVHHITKAFELDEEDQKKASALIASMLTNFEYKEPENTENQE